MPMLSGRGNKALLPLGLQTAHVKGWKRAGEEKAEKKDMGTMVLDLTTRVRSLSFFPKDPLPESGTNREDSLPSPPCCPSCILPTPLLGQPSMRRGNINLWPRPSPNYLRSLQILTFWGFLTLPICMNFALVEPDRKASLLCPQHQPAAFTKFPSGSWQISTTSPKLLPLFQLFFLRPINLLDVGTMLAQLLSEYFLFPCNLTSVFL